MSHKSYKYKSRYVTFFKGLLNKFSSKTELFSKAKVSEKEFISQKASIVGGWYYCILLKNGAKIQLSFWKYLEEKIFDELIKKKGEIEREFGEPLEWVKVKNKIAYHICKKFDKGGRDFPETWPELQDKMVEAMIRLDQVLGPRLEELIP